MKKNKQEIYIINERKITKDFNARPIYTWCRWTPNELREWAARLEAQGIIAVGIDGVNDYGNDVNSYEERPETDREMQKRIRIETQVQREREARDNKLKETLRERELKTLARLKKKYEKN